MQGTISPADVRQTEHFVLGGILVVGVGVCCFWLGFLLLGFDSLFSFVVLLFFFFFCRLSCLFWFSVSSESQTTSSSSKCVSALCWGVSVRLSVVECVSALAAWLFAAGVSVRVSPVCFCAVGTVVLCSVEVFVMLVVTLRGLGWSFSLENGASSVLGVSPWGFLSLLAASSLGAPALLVFAITSNLRLDVT